MRSAWRRGKHWRSCPRFVTRSSMQPENILLNRQGQVKIADFGLAKLVGADVPTHGAERVMGTPQYMAPEQVQHPEDVDHRADIYSLGVVFYQMLTGEFPAKLAEPPSKKVAIDVRLDEVVMRALERDPERRYQQVSEVKTRMETIASTPPASHDRPLIRLKAPLKTSRGLWTTPERIGDGFWRLSSAHKHGRAGPLRRSVGFQRRLAADGDSIRRGAGVGPGARAALGQPPRPPTPFGHLQAEG
jgi:serine/threonine protein kinase